MQYIILDLDVNTTALQAIRKIYGESLYMPSGRRIVRKAGLGCMRFHDLRHTHATLMLQQGVHPKIVQERLGHATIDVTLDIYSHVLPVMQEASALRFEDGLHHRSACEAKGV